MNMKRSKLTRRVGRLKRAARKLKPVSSKRAARNREVADFRHGLCMEVGRCEGCLKPLPAYRLCCHELASGTADRRKAMGERFCILVLCHECHPKIQNENKTTQLARLWLSRPADCDVVAFNRLRRRSPDAITMDEVLAAVKFLERRTA